MTDNVSRPMTKDDIRLLDTRVSEVWETPTGKYERHTDGHWYLLKNAGGRHQERFHCSSVLSDHFENLRYQKLFNRPYRTQP